MALMDEDAGEISAGDALVESIGVDAFSSTVEESSRRVGGAGSTNRCRWNFTGRAGDVTFGSVSIF
jgi:hypothetical protein